MKKTHTAVAALIALSAVTMTASAQTGSGMNAAPGGASAPSMSAPSMSTTPGSANAPMTQGASKADQDFVKNAAIGGMTEVELGQLAQQKAMSDQVKQFGQQMVTDHGKANDELKQIATSKGMQVPASLDKSHQKDMDKLSKLSGAEFDKQYMKNMVADHKKDIAEFTKASKSAKDPDIKAFASKTLPTLQMHLQMAQDAEKTAKSEKK